MNLDHVPRVQLIYEFLLAMKGGKASREEQRATKMSVGTSGFVDATYSPVSGLSFSMLGHSLSYGFIVSGTELALAQTFLHIQLPSRLFPLCRKRYQKESMEKIEGVRMFLNRPASRAP